MAGAIDDALDMVARGASVVAVLLPERGPTFEEYDLDVAAAMADTAHRVLQRQAQSPAGVRLTEADIGCIDPHVASGKTVAARLRMHGSGQIRVNTPEQWQGLETHITVVKHPLTEASGPSGFDLEAGRWCVSLTRHTHGYIIIGRGSIGRVLADYAHECGETPRGAVDVGRLPRSQDDLVGLGTARAPIAVVRRVYAQQPIDAIGGIGERLMFPNSHDDPTLCRKPLIGVAVAAPVDLYLRPPPFRVRLRPGRMQRQPCQKHPSRKTANLAERKRCRRYDECLPRPADAVEIAALFYIAPSVTPSRADCRDPEWPSSAG